MPLNYLEGNQQDIYAINRLGDSFSNAILGLQANRVRQQQFAAQQALERAYFQLAMEKEQRAKQSGVLGDELTGLQIQREKQGLDFSKMISEASEKAAGAAGSRYSDPMARDYASSLTRIAASNPSAAQRMLEPVFVNRGQLGFDPFTREKIYEGMLPAATRQTDPDIAYRTAVMRAILQAASRPLSATEKVMGGGADVDQLMGLAQSLAPKGVTLAPQNVSSAEKKASRANELERLHPDWSRQQIIDAVNKEIQ